MVGPQRAKSKEFKNNYRISAKGATQRELNQTGCDIFQKVRLKRQSHLSPCVANMELKNFVFSLFDFNLVLVPYFFTTTASPISNTNVYSVPLYIENI